MTFTLAEANELIPDLRAMLRAAQAEIRDLLAALKQANDALLEREWRLRQARLERAEVPPLLQSRWNEAAAELEAAKAKLSEREEAWTRAIARRGVVLRDLREGKIDFPADGDFHFCWELGEAEIAFWHECGEGEVARKPLSLLPKAL